jgi:sulfur-oxidizing protein SoxZ
MPQALLTVPKTAKRGDVLEIKTLIQHPMETGYRAGPDGQVLPRDIITRFTCTYAGTEVFRADLFPAMSANPFITFTTVATQSGDIVFSWTGDNGFAQTEKATITVT